MKLIRATAALTVATVLTLDVTSPAPATRTVAAVTQAAAGAINYGSGTWGGVATSKVVTGDPNTANVQILGDSITVRCHSAITKALTAKGLTVAVRAQSGQQARNMVDTLTTQPTTPSTVIVIGGSNDIFNPPGVAGQVARALDHATMHGVKLLWVDTQVARASQTYAVQYADLRNSGWVNNQIHQGLPPGDVIGWNAAIGAAIGRGRPLTYYLQDGVHPWLTAGTGHGDGCAFLAAVIAAAVPGAPR